MTLRFSIVINTYNRADHLANALHALQYLRHPCFEVIVVDGPSTDHTASVLQPYLGRIKVGHCPQTNLAQSRNIGIGLASGDIVCFIDDDGIPEPHWLDALERAYRVDPAVGGAGGFVRDHTGVDYQTRYIVCDRMGDGSFYDHDPMPDGAQPGAERYPSLIGVNSSFRRRALLDIGGFDEEYAYFLDETDVCVRLIDAGWKIVFVPDAQVHHKYALSHLRNERKIPTSLYYTARSKIYFQFRNARPGVPLTHVLQQARHVRHRLRCDVDSLRQLRLIDAQRHTHLMDDIERAYADGIRDAFRYPAGRPMPDAVRQDVPHQPFAALLPTDARLRLILISQDYPPARCGGVGVLMHTLATALAARGHEVSVITRSTGRHTVDFEQGVWVHRVPVTAHPGRSAPALPDLPPVVRDHAYTVYDEAMRIQALRGACVTLSAIWDLESAACVASAAFVNVVYLVTTYQLSLPSKTEWQRDTHYRRHHVQKMIDGERWLLSRAQQPIASTPGIRDDIARLNPDIVAAPRMPVIPFGLPRAPETPPPPPADHAVGATHLLFVGRFEKRKGIDLLLDIIPDLLTRHPQLHIRLAGDHTIDEGSGRWWDRFLERHTAPPPWWPRLHLLGFLDDAALQAEYAHCDLFVAPSRYESFGLIYLEAMRWAKPCIGARVGGIPDILTDDCGLLPPPGDAHALRDAIETLLANPDLRHRMGAAGRQRFEAHYTIDAYIQRLIPLLERAQAALCTTPSTPSP